MGRVGGLLKKNFYLVPGSLEAGVEIRFSCVLNRGSSFAEIHLLGIAQALMNYGIMIETHATAYAAHA